MLAAVGGMYEDNLYLSTLYEYLDTPVAPPAGNVRHGPRPADGIRFEHVSFTYPGASEPSLQDVTLHLPPGSSLALVGENGSGKTTLIKLLTRLYEPSSGRICFEGQDLREWDEVGLRERIGVIFQDFAHYQMRVGENVGVGDEPHFEDSARWREAAEKGRAAAFIEELPLRYETQLGKWFQDGRELSGGQWQKIALSRAFMRTGADVLVLDEPTASMDARAEAEVFEHFRKLADSRITILISHRFSTVRMADQIAVLERGRIIEQGTHASLTAAGGQYAQLFALQARGYQ
jgi:ATP-binding cassette, subfamily B, bacterial